MADPDLQSQVVLDRTGRSSVHEEAGGSWDLYFVPSPGPTSEPVGRPPRLTGAPPHTQGPLLRPLRPTGHRAHSEPQGVGGHHTHGLNPPGAPPVPSLDFPRSCGPSNRRPPRHYTIQGGRVVIWVLLFLKDRLRLNFSCLFVTPFLSSLGSLHPLQEEGGPGGTWAAL